MVDPFEEPPAVRQMYAEMLDFRQQNMNAIGNLMSQINRLNTILFSLLQDLDLVDELNCPECDDEGSILRPKLKNLPPHKNTCPECGFDFDEGQSSIEDFGNEEE